MTAQSYSQGISQQNCVGLFRYSDWLSRYPHLNVRDVLHKCTPREKYVKFQNFPPHFGLLLSLECSDEVSRKSVESAYPINSLKVEVFL